MNNLSWFDIAWPFIGGAGALFLLFLLFQTNRLRSDMNKSRWYDIVWLSWLGAVAYMIHNFEEYGIDIYGRLHEFPETFATILNTANSVGGTPPNAFFTAINLSIVWVGAPIAALLSRRHPLIGLAMYGIMFVNALSHIVPVLTGIGYTPGLLTSIVIFLPLSGWCAYACFGRHQLSYAAMFTVILVSIIAHTVLLGSAMLFINGVISSDVVVFIQVINGGLVLLISWLAEKWGHGKLIQPRA